ncbi:MAG: LuxR C-terminal-related transcriptional regulator [Gordonia amarae]
MTTDINMDLQIPVHPLPTGGKVVVVAEHDLGDAALVALIRGFGHDCAWVDLDADPADAVLLHGTTAVVARSAHGLACARAVAPDALLVGIGVPDGVLLDAVVLPDVAESALRLRAILGENQQNSAVNPDRIHLSDRERDVVSTYVLGSTVYETARRYFISESTVRTHFRRVVTRYTAAGREVNNKSQLLIELIADGWLDHGQFTR